MDKELKKKWVEALRSGKYKQGTGELRNRKDEYCCLGVLCDIHPDVKFESGEDYDYRAVYEDHTCSTNLPESLFTSLGFKGINIPELHNNNIDGRTDIEEYLIHLNDDEEKTFEEIADFIEEKL